MDPEQHSNIATSISTTKEVLALKIEINKKVYLKQADKIKQKIDSLEREYIALKASYNLIEYTLKSELSAVEQQLPPKTNLNLPKPVPATSGSTKPNAANIQNVKPIQVIDLTSPKKERQRCKFCDSTFPDVTTCRIHIRKQHETNTKKSKSVNYSPSKRRISR